MHIRANYLACMLVGMSCWCRGIGMLLEQYPHQGFAVTCYDGDSRIDIASRQTTVNGEVNITGMKTYRIAFIEPMLSLKINNEVVSMALLKNVTKSQLMAINAKVEEIFKKLKAKYKDDPAKLKDIEDGVFKFEDIANRSPLLQELYNAVSELCQAEFGITSRPLSMEKRLRAQPAHILTQALTPDVAQQQLPPVVKPLSTTPTPPIDAAQQPMNMRQTVRNYLYQKAVAFKNAVWPEKYKLTSLAGFGVGAGAVGVAAYLYYLYPKPGK